LFGRPYPIAITLLDGTRIEHLPRGMLSLQPQLRPGRLTGSAENASKLSGAAFDGKFRVKVDTIDPTCPSDFAEL
jgi:hypothetical protein